MRAILLVFLLFLLFNESNAQFYSTGQEPASIKWKQIKTEHFQVVFPEAFTSKGKMLAGYLEEVYKCGGNTLSHHPRRISVIVHANSSISNGMVAWAPKRMELYSVNSQDSYPHDWLQQLAIHEFRHVVQIDKLNVGFTRFLSALFGQQGTGLVVGIYLPTWFLEGDAVATETALTATGRGRLPVFSQGLKAQLLEKGSYSYEKATLGSYKDYVPNHYELGYQLVAHGRLKYGNEIWEKAIDNSGRYSFSFNPFLRAIREVSGLNKRFFYQSVMDSLLVQWQAELTQLQPERDNFLVHDSTNYANYLYPQSNNGRTIAQVQSPEFTTYIASIDSTGSETPLFEIGSRTDEPFHVNNNLMVWSEYRPGVRFQHRNYSVIRSYDFTTQKITTLTHKSRYFAPQLNAANKSILCVDFPVDGIQHLAILDASSGKKVSSVSVGKNEEIISPIWIDNGTKIASILVNGSGKRIAIYDFLLAKWHDLTMASFNDISNLAEQDSLLLFTSHISEQDNLFTINRNSGVIRQITKSAYGSTFGSFGHDGTLLYSSYTSNGYRVAWKNASNDFYVVNSPVNANVIAAKLSANEPYMPTFLTHDTLYVVKNYSRFNLLNFHSWGPFVINGPEIYSGVSIVSQNLLSNTVIIGGYNSDPTFQAEKYSLDISYKGWFPQIDLLFKFGDNKYDFSNLQTSNSTQYVNRVGKGTQFIVEPTISLPLNFSRGFHSVGANPSVSLLGQHYSSVTEFQYFHQRSNDDFLGSKTIVNEPYSYVSARYGIVFYAMKQPAIRDVWSKGGGLLELYYQHSPWTSSSRGALFSASFDLFLPGLFLHDGLKLGIVYEKKDAVYKNNSRYTYPNIYPFCRGFENILADEIKTFKIDYQVPLFCPDATLSGALYLKRVRLNFFADHSFYNRFDVTTAILQSYDLSSVGVDLWADVNFFQWSTPFQIGYRVGYKTQRDEPFYNLLWKINL